MWGALQNRSVVMDTIGLMLMLIHRDIVFVRTSPGPHLGAAGDILHARQQQAGQESFTAEKVLGSGDVRPYDAVYVRASTGHRIAVKGDAVSVNIKDCGPLQVLIVEPIGRTECRPVERCWLKFVGEKSDVTI